MKRPHSSAWPLAAVCLCLVVYASLHPFSGWSEPTPPGAFGWSLPRPRFQARFDLVVNLLAYVPLGLLLATAWVRDGGGRLVALGVALLLSGMLSYALEQGQHFLPPRVPSVLDWQLNSAGAAAGAVLAVGLDALGVFDAWQRWRERWLLHGHGGGITLLLLWPMALLFPPPLPFGLGQVLGRAREVAAGWLEGTAWDGWLSVPAAPALAPLAPGIELLAIVAGLLAPCLLAYTMTRPGLSRAVPLAGGIALGVFATTVSTGLNFGPDNALSWITPPVLPALGLTIGLALLAVWLPVRAAAAVGLLVIATGVALVHGAPSDAYYAASLQAWEQGRFVHLHGLAQWLGWLWPYATLAYLVGRLAARGE
ncbi:MAG TPA: VanZ family protein [Methylibium sp.]|nr:VanZ family protein [Methylibium sp.]